MPTQHSLIIDNLNKSYHGRKVVNDFSLTVKTGEIVGLLGPNGAGKTTSFYMITGLISADSGSCYIDNLNISNLAMYKRARLGIGYLPQEASIFRKMSVMDNILAVLELNPKLTADERKHRALQLLKDFRIDHLANNIGRSLSGGERRRTEIARALANEPKFLLLDEPFAGIDPISIDEMKIIIQSLSKRNIGILITDHNVREALSICTKASVFHLGKVIASGTSDEIINNALVKQHYLGNKFNHN